jgi:hypothetical protein
MAITLDKINIPLFRVIGIVGMFVSAAVWTNSTLTSVNQRIDRLTYEVAALKTTVRNAWTTEEHHLFSEAMQYENPSIKVPKTADIIQTYAAIKRQRGE